MRACCACPFVGAGLAPLVAEPLSWCHLFPQSADVRCPKTRVGVLARDGLGVGLDRLASIALLLPPLPHDQAEKLESGSMFITFTKPLPSRCFEILDKKRFDMSWGESMSGQASWPLARCGQRLGLLTCPRPGKRSAFRAPCWYRS